MTDIREYLTTFSKAFIMKNCYKPPEWFYDINGFADMHARDIGNLQNPIRAPWWSQVKEEDIIATCEDPLKIFLISRLSYPPEEDANDATLLYTLGKSYENGTGVEKDIAVAFTYYQTAAELGNLDAQFNLGFCLISGSCGTVDETAGFKWLLKAANAGHVSAKYYAGLCYDRGMGVDKDEAMALSLFIDAAKNGNEDAQHLL